MKKLMFTLATAALVGGATAAVCDDCGIGATAYTMSLTLKTTAPKTSVKADDCDKCSTTCTYYNTQKTVKFSGLVWGEAECDDCSLSLGDQFLLWTTTYKKPVTGAALNMKIGAYEKTNKKAEAYGSIDTLGGIMLGGFGSMYVKSTSKEVKCELPETTCYSYVKSLSGNAAGFIDRAWLADAMGVDVSDCELLTGCCDDQTNEKAAASGTWKVSYNQSLAKKLAKLGDVSKIGQAYKIPSYVDVSDDLGTSGADDIVIDE